MKKDKKIKLIKALAILLIIILIVMIIICNNQKQKKEQQLKQIFSVLDSWADGDRNSSLYLPSWNSVKNKNKTNVEKKIVEIVKNQKDDPHNLAYFLYKIEQEKYMLSSVNDELSKLEFDFNDRLSFSSSKTYYETQYYKLPKVTKDEIMAYVNKNGEKKLHFTKGTGGFYDGEEDSYDKDEVGLKGSPLYEITQITYSGDFKTVSTSGVQLDRYYKEQHYSGVNYYYKDKSVNFYYLQSECYLSGDYLFAFYNGETHVLDVVNNKYYYF